MWFRYVADKAKNTLRKYANATYERIVPFKRMLFCVHVAVMNLSTEGGGRVSFKRLMQDVLFFY